MKSGMSGMAQFVAMTCMVTGASALSTHTAKSKGSTSSGGLLWLSETGERSRTELNASLNEGSGALSDLSFLHLVSDPNQHTSALELSAGVAAGAGELPSTPLDAAVIAMMRKGTPAFESFLPDCLAHTKRIAHAMDDASPQSQTVPTLERECLGEKPFAIFAAGDAEQKSTCHDFALHLVAARQEEMRSGSQEGYQAFCAYFYGLKYFGAKDVELKPSEKKQLAVLTIMVVSGLIAIAVLAALRKQAEEMKYASSPPDQSRVGRRSRVPEQPKHCRWLVCGEEPESERPEEA